MWLVDLKEGSTISLQAAAQEVLSTFKKEKITDSPRFVALIKYREGNNKENRSVRNIVLQMNSTDFQC